MHMQAIARNNLQLYNELRRQGRSGEELALVKAAYELATRLYSGYYQSDGRPFVLHTVGVAGILALLRMPAEIIALGLVHNVYSNGNFGDGRSHVYSTYRNAVIVDAVGPDVADLVKRFRDRRITSKSIARMEAEFDGLGQTDRYLLALELADYCEKYLDQSVLYFGDASWVTDEVSTIGDRLIGLANRLELPDLAALMSELFEAVARQEPPPPALMTGPKHKYLYFIMPMSARTRIRTLMSGWYRRYIRGERR
jgi:hypothetical protein